MASTPLPAGGISTAPPGESHLRQLTPLLVWAVVFCDIGTSVYYVPGILYDQVGDAAPLFVGAALIAFLLLAAKYVEICWRRPDGGGVVSIASEAFSPPWGCLGGLLISVDYFLTSAISSVSGIHHLGSVFPDLNAHIVSLASVALGLLAVINIIGIRESALVSLFMAVIALLVNLVVVVLVLVKAGPAGWTAIKGCISLARDITPGAFLVGFSGAWLAFSGLESISQLSPAMRLPLERTASRGMRLVVITVLATTPILTLFSVALLPENVKALHSEEFISELGAVYGALPIKMAVVLSASALLLFAANTAIIGCYHVFVALAERGFMPSKVAARNPFFHTPEFAIGVATVVPILVILATQGDMVRLGELYAFGLLGAFVLSSVGVDMLRWREKQRGARFWVGILTTLLVLVAWCVNLVVKQEATLFGTVLVGIGMLIGFGTQQKVFADVFYRVPLIANRTRGRILESEHELETVREIGILSLSQAQSIVRLFPSSTLVALRSADPGLVQEAVVRERGLRGSNLFAIYVEERTGLFVRTPTWRPEQEGVHALRTAAAAAEAEGMTLIPVWTISHNAVEGIARAAQVLGVSAVLVGVSQRGAIYHLLRGHVVRGLSRALPANVRLLLRG